MAFRFNGISGTSSQRRPRKAYNRRTGLFDRNLGDEIKSRHEGTEKPSPEKITKSNRKISDKRKNMFLAGISDQTLKLIAFIFSALILIALILRLLKIDW
jgi:hypothetical protein